jgi:5-methylcytosine-specific restriction protein A
MKKIYDLYEELDAYTYDEITDTFTKISSIVSTTSKTSIPTESSPSLPKGFMEGGINQIVLEVQYRSPQLRKDAITANKGYSCYICGENFEEKYGEYGKGYIEIHHKKPLKDNSENHLTTINDVAVVCANCHSVLHHNGKEPLDVEFLKEVVRNRMIIKTKN